MKKYAVVIEQGPHYLSADVPDLPGCITTGRTLEEIERNIREAIELHLDGLREDGDRFPSRTQSPMSSYAARRDPPRPRDRERSQVCPPATRLPPWRARSPFENIKDC
jgi:predicted RNase H-like HicB family nuclease